MYPISQPKVTNEQTTTNNQSNIFTTKLEIDRQGYIKLEAIVRKL